MTVYSEADARGAMDEPEFWAHVGRNVGTSPAVDYEPDDEPLEPPRGICPECGELAACAYDAEGRALVHTDRFEVDE